MILSFVIRSLVLFLIIGSAAPLSHAQSDELEALNAQVAQLYRAGNYAKATGVAEQALQIAELQHDKNNVSVITSINNLAELYRVQRRYTEAEPLYKRILRAWKNSPSSYEPIIGKTLNHLADMFQVQGRYTEAEPLYKRSLAIRERKLGPSHPDVGTTLNNLAELYRLQGRYTEAEPLFKRSLAIREKALATIHPNVGTTLNNLALLYLAQGRFAEAGPLFKRSLRVWEKVLGPNHPYVGTALNNLARLNEAQGRFTEAEPFYKRSLRVWERALGPDHPTVGTMLNNLAELYRLQGRYTEAEPLYKRSLTIRQKALAANHPSIGTSLNNLATLYKSQGRYSEAEPLYMRSLRVAEKAVGTGHPNVGTALNNLAGLYDAQGRYTQAEPLYKRSLAIRVKALGSNHPDVGISLSNLAALYAKQGRYADAESLYRRSLAIAKSTLDDDHPDVGTRLNNLALLYVAQGRYTEAEPLYKRSLAIQETVLGPDHPIVSHSLTNLAWLYREQEDWRQATDYYRRGIAVITRRARHGIHTFGQKLVGKQKSEASRLNFKFTGFVTSAYHLKRHNDIGLRSEAFQSAQWATASDTAASLAKMAARQATGITDLAELVRERQDLIDEWQKRDASRIKALTKQRTLRNENQEARNTARLNDIDKRIAVVDQRLAKDFPEYAALAAPEPLAIVDTQSQLRPNEALVLFLDTPTQKPTPAETFIWVVTKDESRWVRSELGGKALADSVKALRCGLDSEAWKDTTCLDLLGRGYGGPGNTYLPFELTRAHKLYQSLFGQVEDLIAGKDLLIVPSGPLTQLPFQVLVTEKPAKDELSRTAFSNAAWLIKKHAITVLPSVSSLKALRAHAKTSKADQTIVGFGNPLLEGDGVPDLAKAARDIQGCAQPGYVRTANLRTVQRATVMPMGRGTKLTSLDVLRIQTPLPETADELCAVARSAGSDIRYLHLGQAATEARIKDLSA
ncbi:MAG: tetratricopeptide repeat protein, partial [Pseudomonadota bacterium]